MARVRMVEQYKLEGRVTVSVFRHGRLVRRWVNKNTILNQGVTQILGALKNGGAAVQIDKIGFSDSGVAPLASDTGLGGTLIIEKTITDVTINQRTQSYFVTLNQSEANTLIKKIGLRTSAQYITALLLNPFVNKSSSEVIVFEYALSF